MHMHGGAGQAVQAGHVIFVDMAHDHQLGGVELGTDKVGDERRVQGGANIRAPDQHLVSIGIFSVLRTEEDGDATEVGAPDRLARHRLISNRSQADNPPLDEPGRVMVAIDVSRRSRWLYRKTFRRPEDARNIRRSLHMRFSDVR